LEKTNTEVATLEGKLSTVKETNTDLTTALEDSNTKVGELNENLSSAKEDLASQTSMLRLLSVTRRMLIVLKRKLKVKRVK
jgi:predicted  nucleic acid-binding Zn-ribbon protein